MLSQIWDSSALILSIARDDVFYPDVWYIDHSLFLYHFDALSFDLKSKITRNLRSINKMITSFWQGIFIWNSQALSGEMYLIIEQGGKSY